VPWRRTCTRTRTPHTHTPSAGLIPSFVDHNKEIAAFQQHNWNARMRWPARQRSSRCGWLPASFLCISALLAVALSRVSHLQPNAGVHPVHPDGGVVAVVIVAIGDCPVLVHQPHTCLSAPTSQDSVTTIVAAPTHITCVCTNRIRATCTSYARCSHEELRAAACWYHFQSSHAMLMPCTYKLTHRQDRVDASELTFLCRPRRVCCGRAVRDPTLYHCL
jgi:hypothetical protein